jgi:hypothetical protein
MAILKGFPPSNLISPSVRIAEKDLSFIAPEQSGHRAGLVGFASKGPINIPTLVTTSRQLHTIFGWPHPQTGDPYLLYAAEQYLLVATELFIVRCGDVSPVSDEAAKTASVDVLTAGGAVEIEGNITIGSGPDWVVPTPQFFRFRLNGILSSNVLTLLDGTYSDPDDVVDQLNAQLSALYDGIQFYTVGSGSSRKLAVKTTFAYGPEAELELVSVKDSLYGPDSVFGLGTGMSVATQTGTEEQYPPSSVPDLGHYDLSTFDADSLNLQVVIDGSDSILIDNVVQTVNIASDDYATITDLVTALNDAIANDDLPGGFQFVEDGDSVAIETLHVGRDAKLLVKSDSTLDTILGLDNLTHSGSSGSPCPTLSGSTYTCGIVNGSENDDTVCFTVTADTPGVDGNETQLVITNHIADGDFTIEIYSYGNQVEAWGNLTKDPTSRYYVESYIALVSDFIRVIDNVDTLASPLAAPAGAPLQLSGGTDGIPSDPSEQDAKLLGSIVSMTGLQALSDPEQVDIDLIAIPGHTSTDIAIGLIEFAGSTRADCFAIIDSPFGLTVKEVISWQNGTHPLNDMRFDSDFAALYWPWVKLRDTFNRIDVWVPPSGSVMAAFARSDNIGAPWLAPAGANRGLAPNVLDAFSRPTLEERDSMYGNRNAVNPIIQFIDLDGFYIWGQKTLQRTPTALDRVNVRRMLLYVEKRIKSLARNLLFEPNDDSTRTTFTIMAEGVLKTVQTERGLTDYIIKCDTELNTPDVIDRNELRARIGVQPTRAAEFIFIEFSIHRTGSFAESTSF